MIYNILPSSSPCHRSSSFFVINGGNRSWFLFLFGNEYEPTEVDCMYIYHIRSIYPPGVFSEPFFHRRLPAPNDQCVYLSHGSIPGYAWTWMITWRLALGSASTEEKPVLSVCAGGISDEKVGGKPILHGVACGQIRGRGGNWGRTKFLKIVHEKPALCRICSDLRKREKLLLGNRLVKIIETKAPLTMWHWTHIGGTPAMSQPTRKNVCRLCYGWKRFIQNSQRLPAGENAWE